MGSRGVDGGGLNPPWSWERRSTGLEASEEGGGAGGGVEYCRACWRWG